MITGRRKQDRDGAHLAAGLARYALGIPAARIIGGGRSSLEVSRARHVAMYLAHVGFGMSLGRVADAFERDRSTVAHGCRVVEDRRDDPQFDAWMEALETSIEVMAPLHWRAA